MYTWDDRANAYLKVKIFASLPKCEPDLLSSVPRFSRGASAWPSQLGESAALLVGQA